jgi:hypothetical protein
VSQSFTIAEFENVILKTQVDFKIRKSNMKTFYLLVMVLLTFLSGMTSTLAQQSDLQKTEIGGFVSIIDLRESVGEKPFGFGGRFSYNVNDNFAVDGEVVHFPQNPSGDFSETQGVVGVKAGIRKEKFGVFAKVRPGIIRFGGDFFKARNNGARNNFVVDAGGVFEYYPSSRVILRIDVGDSIIPFGNDLIYAGSLLPVQPKTTHNLQTSFGVGFRF